MWFRPTGARLIRGLLTLARGGHHEVEHVDPVERLSALSDMVRQTVGSGVSVAFELEERCGSVAVDPTQFDLAILNLAANARDAMPNGGALTIAAHPEAGSNGPRGSILISVSDTGIGFPQAALSPVFEPFYTTKPEGKGTGLGLTQVYGFVQRALGSVEVESREGTGTTIVLRLPVAGGPADSAKQTAGLFCGEFAQ